MLAGRPHEAAGNGSPRWMAAGPRSRGCTEPGLQAGSPLTHPARPRPARCLLHPLTGEAPRACWCFNRDMVVIFGFGAGKQEDLGEVVPTVCPNCHNQVFLHHVRSKKSVRLYFVPVVPYGTDDYLVCPVCSRGLQLSGPQVRHLRSMSAATASFRAGGFPTPSSWRRPTCSGVSWGCIPRASSRHPAAVPPRPPNRVFRPHQVLRPSQPLPFKQPPWRSPRRRLPMTRRRG